MSNQLAKPPVAFPLKRTSVKMPPFASLGVFVLLLPLAAATAAFAIPLLPPLAFHGNKSPLGKEFVPGYVLYSPLYHNTVNVNFNSR